METKQFKINVKSIEFFNTALPHSRQDELTPNAFRVDFHEFGSDVLEIDINSLTFVSGANGYCSWSDVEVCPYISEYLALSGKYTVRATGKQRGFFWPEGSKGVSELFEITKNILDLEKMFFAAQKLPITQCFLAALALQHGIHDSLRVEALSSGLSLDEPIEIPQDTLLALQNLAFEIQAEIPAK